MVRPLVLSLLVAASASAADTSITYPAKPGPGGGKHLVFLTGDQEYRGEEGLPMLAKILSQRHGFQCTVLFPLNPDGTINPDLVTSLADADQLDSADGIVMQLRYRAYPDSVMKKFAAAIDRGVPIIGLRTSTHAFNFPAQSKTSYRRFNNFGRNVLGENWVNHWGGNRQGLTRGVVEPGSENDPLLRGVTDVIGDSGVYETHPVPDAKILLRGQVLKGMKATDPPATWKKKWASDKTEHGANDPMMPVAWVRENRGKTGTNRVFCTTMGAATDMQNEGLRRLVVNAVYWAFNKEVPAKADVSYVDEYKPSPYAFSKATAKGYVGYRRGLTPADHALGKVLPPDRPSAKK
ncbi:MAG TPA: ThuA domain-containing protein [Fimbriiglobus sp.]|jgi:type 1 glutamine amidotransferase